MRRRSSLVAAAVALSCLVAFWELAEDFAYAPAIRAFDLAMSAAIVSLRSPWLTGVMRVVTASGGIAAVTVATVGLVAWQLSRHRRVDAFFSAAVVGGGSLAVVITKDLFGRARPPVLSALIALPGSYSFPSGHSLASLCLGAAIGFAVMESRIAGGRKVAALMACGAYPLAVGFSRVYLGVHFPSDVLASWLLGGVVIAATWGAIKHRALREARGGTSGR